ncbi:MAG: cobalamin biosynthesis protein, partial [Lachnospiraceae bacterium]|nr:cobalamin biosynthesis protein [Lachnospiraceae bacterium]
MKRAAICFSPWGMELIEKLNLNARDKKIEEFEQFACGDFALIPGFTGISDSLTKWTGKMFENKTDILFVGAMGIAVRAIAPFVKDKLSDSAVVVMDDMGKYVIPVLSGHVGGANKLSGIVGELTGATPVITTSTDVHNVFSGDTFAKENNLSIGNKDGIKKVNLKAIEGKNITISVKDYPPSKPVDIIVADDTDREYSLLLKPKKYILGLGMKKDCDHKKLEDFVLENLEKKGVDITDIYCVATIDIKENEP